MGPGPLAWALLAQAGDRSQLADLLSAILLCVELEVVLAFEVGVWPLLVQPLVIQ